VADALAVLGREPQVDHERVEVGCGSFAGTG
jgi:hypothetical protein